MAHHFVDNVHTKSFTPREYQVELLDAAKERNIIVCLGTESGKSFIAMKLIQEMANDTRREFGRRRDGGRGGKCTLFLVEQKKKAGKVSLGLRNLTDLTVSNIWHTEPVSSEWSDERWMQELRLHQVLVMSGQMCYTILNRGILSLKYVNLLIMDQCHRAIKGHPYTKIMSDFYQRLPRKQRPRILGLTTPLLLLLGCPAPERERPKEVFHPGCLEARLERLEKNLDCTAETASDIVSLLRYCPRPRELVVEWSLANESDPVGIALSKNIEFELTAAWNFLQDHRYDPMEIYQDAEFAEELSRIPDPKTDPIAVLKDFMHILKTLGPWCADRAALLLLIHLDKLKVKTPYERHFLLLCMITTIMVKIRGICDLTFQEYNECERIYKFSTPKVLRLLEILREFLPPVTATKTDMLPIVKVKDDTRNVKGLQSTNKEDALLKEQKKDGNIIINEIKNELKTNTLQGMYQTSFDSNAMVSNQAEQSNSKKEISCQASVSRKEDELKKETLKDDTQIKESNANYPVPLEIVAKTEPNFCPDVVEGVKKCEKNNFPNSNSDSSFAKAKNISVTEVDIITNSLNKENLNFTENILCENSSVGNATELINKESSIWERGGGKGGRRWGGYRGRGRGGGGRGGGGRGGGGRGGHSNRSGPDFPVSDSLCGIVFVDGRFTAKILYHLLNDLRRSDPQFASLAAQYTVGCSMPAAGDNTSLLDPRETEAEFRKQEEVLKRFRTHECNLLIGPTGWALEDGGLELPRCNLVLRFDHESISTEIVSLPGNFNTVQTLSTDGNKFMEVTHSCVSQNAIESESLCELKLNNCDTVKLFEENEITKISHNDITESISCKFKVTDSSFHSSKLSSETELFEDVPQVKNSLVGGTGNDNATPSFVGMSEGITTKNLINCVLKNDHDGQASELMGNNTQSCERKEDVSGSEDDNIFIMTVEGCTDTSRKHENDEMGMLGEEVVSRIPVSYHSYARSRARARAPDAHHIIMAAEGEEARRVVDSLAHFMQIEEMLLCRCKNREPPEEEEVEADGVTLQGETYCPASFSSNTTNSKVPRCGDQFIGQQLWNNLCAKDDAKGEKACVTLATAISLVNRYCAKLPSDTFTRLTPLWSLKKGKGAGGDPSYTCALRLPINSPVKQDILGCPMPSKALARRSAALEACKVLHQARELDDDLMPVGKESFRAEVESDEDEEEEEVEEEEDEEESVGENVNPHEDEAKMDSSAVNISESVKVEKVEKAVNEICLKKENLDEINFNIKLEVSKDIPQITCEEMENAITNEEVGIKDFTLRETIMECEQIAIEKEKRGILFVKENQETRTCFVEMGSRLENPVNGEVNKELILTQYITQSRTSLKTLDSDEKVESEFNNTANNTTNGMNNADETNVGLVDREVDKDLPISSHLKKVVENGSVKISSFKCCSDRSLKSFDQASPSNKNTSNAMLSEVIPELPGKLGMLKDIKEIIISESDAKFIEMKEHKHKARKKQEEEDLEEEGEEEELPIGEGITGNCVFDRPRPGTTKRRQYYYKRTADALTDCRPLPMHPAYLYNIGMKLVCPLPDEQNTRGRRIHPPEDSPRGFGILTLKEIPKICPFPIFTRSGEVQVGLEPCKSAGPGKSWKACNPLHSYVAENLENKFNVLRNGMKGVSLPDPQQILLTEEQLSKALAFLNYTFAGVLRLQRYLMAFDPVASENSYLIVPTMAKKRAVKDGSNEEMREKNLSAELIEVDWEFVDVIYGCKGESKPVPVSEEERKSFEFESSLYHDAVVMPWYRNQDQPQYFYVAEICTHLSPKSSFPGSEYRTFEEYYFKKYAIQICNREQPLLDVDHTSARLNFLTPRYVNRKGVALPTSSEETKRAKRESLEQKQILVPELCSRHPFPASLWRKAVCLPCILYRLNALLLADQLRARVAREIGVGLEKVPKDFDWPPLDFGWSLADVLKKSKETENQNVESKKRVNSGNGGDKIDSNKEEKNSDEEESDAVEGEERKKPKKKGLKRKRRKKKSEQESGEDRSDDDDEADDDDDDDDDDVSEKNEGEDWMEIGTWSNEMAVQMASGMIPPLPDNVTMVEEGGREGWGGAVIASKAHATGERVRYGSPSIWKGSGAPVEVFSGLEHELEGLETTDSSGDDDDDDAPEDEEGVEEAVLIPEEEVEDRGHHPRGKLRIQFKSDYLAEAVEVLDESVDDDCLLKAVTEAGEDEEEVGVIEEEEEESSWFLEDDEMEERQLLDQYVQRFEHAVLNNKKMIESSGMLLHSGEQFSLNTKVGRLSLETEQKVKVTPYCLVGSLDLVCKDQDKSESFMTNTNTEDGDFMSLDSLSDDEDIFLDMPCENLQVGDCDSEEVRELSPQKTSEGICRVGSSCSSCSSVCSCCSSCSSCSSPFSSLEEDLPEEDVQDVYMTDFGAEHFSESLESNPSFSFDAQPPLEGHPGPSPPLLLQALTMSNANDGINLERLETIGDSFLKYAITAYLYCTHHSIHEGKLSHLRSKQVSNVNLYRLGRRKRLGESMIAAKFEPHDNWLPPCYHVPLHLERALIRAGLPPSHWNGAEVPSLASLSPAQIGRVVREKGRRMMMKSLAEQESSLKSPTTSRILEGTGLRSIGFEGNLNSTLERGCKIEVPRIGNFGRCDLSSPGGGRSMAWDKESRNKGFEQGNLCNGTSRVEGVHSKDSIPLTGDCDNRVEELPCFVPYNLVTQQSIPDKSVADCVEALIGAYLIACGPRGALLFMAWLGIRVLPSQKVILNSPKDLLLNEKQERPVGCMLPKETAGHKGELYQVNYGALMAPPPPLALSSCSQTREQDVVKLKEIPRYHCDSLCKHCLRVRRKMDSFSFRSNKHERGSNKKNFGLKVGVISYDTVNKRADNEGTSFEVNPAVKKELKALLGGLNEFEKHIGYNFRDRSLLLQALTHASYSPNRLTDCYQRLEFLGDAVLDYLITRHLYEDPRQHSPGALTDLRSALVNNTIFASLAVRHGFHRFFLHLSPGLHSVVERFVRMQASNGHAICEEYYLIEEEECEEAEDVEVPKALGDVFESVAGAIFLDSGMSLDAVWRVYYRMMKAEIEQFSTNVPKSPIRELLEMEPETAKFGKPEKLADGRRVRVTVEVFGKGTFKGIGRNYRIAKCTAAKCALRQLKKRGLLFPRKN